MNPRHPVYIVSKGRWDSRLTSKALEKMGVPYHIIVENCELDNYAKVIDAGKILVLPDKYLNEYDTFDDLGDSKSKGPGAARNFAWDHSILSGASRHWVMDDNISGFCRYNHNLRIKVESGTILRCCEDFTERYENVPISGLQYRFFASRCRVRPAYLLNSRIYSCLLIDNSLPFRWRGRYNEDTDLSLRALKAGFCTILFVAFLQNKAGTQTIKGGCNTDFYENEGTLPKSQMLAKMHPDVARVNWNFGRWHHEVNYRPFKKNALIRKSITWPIGINEYGMKLVDSEADSG